MKKIRKIRILDLWTGVMDIGQKLEWQLGVVILCTGQMEVCFY